MTQAAVFVFGFIIAAVLVFQVCLIAGAPWGRLTQGGRNEGVLPASGRVAAFLSIPLLLCMFAGIASAAGMPPNWPAWTGWVALCVQALSTVLNWITPSRPERLLWGPITTAMLLLAGYAVLASDP